MTAGRQTITQEVMLIAETGKLLPVKFPISRHLSILKEADLVRDAREGQFIFYELNVSVLEETILWISDLKGDEDHDKK